VQHPQVALLDISLPGMDGYELARRLRSQPSLGQAVLVALTGWGLAEDRRRSKEAGFDHHLVKPVDLSELQDLLALAQPQGTGP
jgi:CheY-like chemotaxis protein